jgi:hypothetical protein
MSFRTAASIKSGRHIARSAHAGCFGRRNARRFTRRTRCIWQWGSRPALAQVALITPRLISAHIRHVSLLVWRNARRIWRIRRCAPAFVAQVALFALALVAAQYAFCGT